MSALYNVNTKSEIIALILSDKYMVHSNTVYNALNFYCYIVFSLPVGVTELLSGSI